MKKILSFAKSQQNNLVTLIKTLCRIPAPSLHEKLRSDFCKEYLLENGCEGVFTDEAMNVIYPYNYLPNKPVIVLQAHLDTVFPDLEPMEVIEADGKLHCPGVGDDTANVAMLLLLATYFAKEKPLTEYGILFVYNTGEEGLGNLKGTKQLFKEYGSQIKKSVSFDCSYETVYNRAVGSSRFKVTIHTTGGHSLFDFGNRNSIAVLSSLITELYGIDVSNLEGTVTYNVGMIEGGTSINTIAQEASMLYEFRSDNPKSLDLMQKRLDEILDRFCLLEDVKIGCEVLGKRPSSSLDVDSAEQRELEALVTEVFERRTGTPPEFKSGSTDSNIPLSLGIPALTFGGYLGKGIHTREEWLDIASLETGFSIICDFAKNLCIRKETRV